MDLDVVAAAEEASKTGGTKEGARIMKDMAGLTTTLTHRQFQFEVAEHILFGLQAVQAHAKKCVQLLVEALAAKQPSSDLAADAIWMINKLTEKCSVTRQWVLDANGAAAARRALEAYPDNRNLVLCAVWTSHTLDGLLGLAALLGYVAPGSGPCTRFADPVVSAAVWVVHAVRIEDIKNSHEPRPETELLLRLMVELIKMRSNHEELLRACCFAIEALIRDEPRAGALLVQLGGVPLLLRALQKTAEEGGSDHQLAQVCADALASLAQGAAAGAARSICQQSGAPDILLRIATGGCGKIAGERAMLALGQLAGLAAVAKAMHHAPTVKEVLRGGLDAIAQLADKPADEDEVRLLPIILNSLLALRAQIEGETSVVKCRHKCVKAICATARGLAEFAEPGQCPDLDLFVVTSLHIVTAEQDDEIVEDHLACLGHIALLKDSWRAALHSREAPAVAARVIDRFHQQRGHRKLMKYSFWFAASLSGIGFVAQQLQLNMQSSEVVDAALCTVIDILDEDIEGDWVLSQARPCSDAEVPKILELIINAMAGHLNDVVLQSRGCHCIGLLLPLASPSEILVRAVSAVLAASRRHLRKKEVARDCCYALRAILQLPGGGGGNMSADHYLEEIIAHLRREQAEDVAERALAEFPHADEPGLLEDATFVLTAVSGIDAVLKALVDAGPGPVRSSGTKALFEFGRQYPQLLRRSGSNVLNTLNQMLGQSGTDSVLQQHARMLEGLCSICAA